MPSARHSPDPASSSRPPDGIVVDDIFRALSDPTRRQVLERLSRSPASTGELAEPFEMALPSLLQHLKLLEGCGLVRSEKRGRVRTYHLETKGMKLAEGWLSKQRTFWEQRLNQLDDYLLKLKGQTE
jgi:DNA-binding transcriptional ArsR family regulator